MTQLGLGAAQFGMPYGISNARGQTTQDEVRHILALAAQSGVRVLDTAPAYGNSESALGASLPAAHPFQVVTKIPKAEQAPDAGSRTAQLMKSVERSLASLRQNEIYGLLLHDADDLFRPGGAEVWRAMHDLRDAGTVRKIGVSVYTARQIEAVLADFDPDLVQLPVNALDQRLLKSGHLARLKRRNIEIHARSVFLQGLLLMTPKDVPGHLLAFGRELSGYEDFVARLGLTRLQAALAFICQVEEVDVALVGVNCASQLQECVEAFRSGCAVRADFSAVACDDEALVNPALWSTH